MDETTLSSSSALSRSHRRLRAAADMVMVLLNKWAEFGGRSRGVVAIPATWKS